MGTAQASSHGDSRLVLDRDCRRLHDEPLVEFQGQERYLGAMARRAPLTVSLPAELEDFVSSQVASGRYDSPSEVVSEGLRLLEELEIADDAALEDARPAIAVGLEQARRGELLDGEEVFKTLEERIRSKA
jgi:antitoxin ParD1/3/4